jgi:hypothetical protein
VVGYPVEPLNLQDLITKDQHVDFGYLTKTWGFPAEFSCKSLTLKPASVSPNGFFVYAAFAREKVNKKASELCGIEVRGDRVLIVHVVHSARTGRKLLNDLPDDWKTILPQYGEARRRRDVHYRMAGALGMGLHDLEGRAAQVVL